MWTCSCGLLCEDNTQNHIGFTETDLLAEDDDYRHRRLVITRKSSIAQSKTLVYQTHLSRYNALQLTNISDIYNAFAEVYQAIYYASVVDIAYRHGLSVLDFDSAFL